MFVKRSQRRRLAGSRRREGFDLDRVGNDRNIMLPVRNRWACSAYGTSVRSDRVEGIRSPELRLYVIVLVERNQQSV